jgi:predicted component of type VI protein secretion system
MPQLTVVLGRKPVQVYNLEQTRVRIGREAGVDIVIDNPGVSRLHAELRKEGDGWTVTDMGSSNGTFLNGQKISATQLIKAGDEIGLGKYSVLFEKALAAPAVTGVRPAIAAAGAEATGTMHIKAHEVTQLLNEASKQRRAHIVWEAGGQKGTHHLADAPAVLVGTDDLCDVRVPAGPKHHLLIIRKDKACEIRNLAMFGKMKVGGAVTRKARLKDGDVVEMSGVKLTFVGELGG